jgi:hypothetical protein
MNHQQEPKIVSGLKRGENMKKDMGVWIDREKAFLVTLMGDKELNTFVESNVEGRVRLSGGSRSRTPYGPQDVASERKRDERHRHRLREYYQRIIRELEDAHRILIFGPGEAKIELENEIKKSKKFSPKIVSVEPADKMMEAQIAAKVRNAFRPGKGESGRR